MDPTAPSQPSLNTVYNQPSNPAQSTPSETQSSTSASASQSRSDPIRATRHQNDVMSVGGKDQSEATPSSLGYGALSSDGDAGEAMGPGGSNTEGEQMRAAGEGDVAAAQEGKHGFGAEKSLTAGLEEKKSRQAEIKEARGSGGSGEDGGGVNVGAVMGGEGFVGAEENRSQGMGGGGGLQSSHANV